MDCCNVAVTARLGLVIYLLSLTKRRETSAFNSRNVHEYVVAAFIWLDEAETLLAIEPLYSAACHQAPPEQLGNPLRRHVEGHQIARWRRPVSAHSTAVE